jgi:hypothetical protein
MSGALIAERLLLSKIIVKTGYSQRIYHLISYEKYSKKIQTKPTSAPSLCKHASWPAS